MFRNSKAAFGFIFVTVLLDCIGFGVIAPVLPRLLQTIGHCTLSRATQYSAWLGFAYAGMQFLCAPIIGSLSDRYGRRPVLLVSLLGFGIDYLFLALAPTVGWFFIGRILSGMFGASFTTASAYIADISTPEKKAQNFGLLGVAFGVGFILGPVLGGICAQWGQRVPFMVSAGLSLINWLYGMVAVPESLKLENRRAFNWKRANPIGALMNIDKYPSITGLILGLFMLYLAGSSVQTTWGFFGMAKFSWAEKTIGYSLAVVGISVAIVQGGLIRVIVPKLGQKWSIYSGLIIYSLGLCAFAFAPSTPLMFAAIGIYCLGGIAGPSFQSMMSGIVPANEQGELQGLLTSLQSLSFLMGSLLMPSILGYFISTSAPVYFPGAAFILGALFVIVGLFFTIWSIEKHHGEKVN